MHLTLQLDTSTGAPPTSVQVQARAGATLGDLLSALQSQFAAVPWWHPGWGESVTVDGVALPPAARLGSPPLLQGAVLHGGRSADHVDAQRLPSGTRSTERAGLLRLHVVSGPDCGAVLELPPGRHLLGRAPGCSLQIHDDALSREHAVLEVNGTATTIADCRSTNGTWVDGSRVGAAPAVLAPGARVQVGDSTITVHSPDLPAVAARGDGTGHLLISRAPRRPGWQPGAPIAFPDAPAPESPRHLPWAALVLPLVFSVVIAAVTGSPTMLLFGLMSPLLMLGQWWSDRRSGRRLSRTEKARYAAALAAADAAVATAIAEEAQARRAADPGPAWHLALARYRLAPLWDRTTGPVAGDAAGLTGLTVRIGVGSAPSRVTTSGHHRTPRLTDVPVTVDLTGCCGVAGHRPTALATARAVLGALVCRHSPAQLAIAVDPAVPQKDWQWLTRLPHALHAWPDETDPRRVAHALTEAASGRAVLVVTESPARVQPGDSVHIFAVAPTPTALPAETTTVLDLTGAHSVLTGAGEVSDLVVDAVPARWADRLADALHPLRDVAGARADAAIPARVGLLHLLALPGTRGGHSPSGGPDRQHRPDLARHWLDHPRSTRFPVGATAAGALWLDLVRDGPHGLVGGTTGSGKSELLVSLVAGLAAQNRPDELAFVLVDYKGGAAFGACRDLPHVVGLVTDLDHHLTERALVSLDAELKRREHLLQQRDVADLAAYQRAWREGDERIPRLVIVVDEFRSLAEELPDFVSGLVRVASLGRSLGVHLVVATQRPGGVVTADMRANLGLRVGLRVRDAVDSLDVLDVEVAAEIAEHTPGRAFVQSAATGLTEVQTPLATGPVSTDDDPPVAVVTIGGMPVPTAPQLGASRRTELDLLVEAAREAVVQLGIRVPDSPWLPPLPPLVLLADLVGPTATDTGDAVALGRTDEPAAQRQTPWCWRPHTEGNLGIAGAPRSGRSTALVTVAAALARRFGAHEVHLYAVHTGGLLGLEALPHVGACVPASDIPRLGRLLTLLGADPPEDIRRVLLVDDWERVVDALERARATALSDQLLALARRGSDARLSLVVTGARGLLSGQVAGALTRRVLLLPADPIDVTLLGVPASVVPEHPPVGRAIDAATHAEVQVAAVAADPTPQRCAAYLRDLAATLPTPPAGTGPVPVPELPRQLARRDLTPEQPDGVAIIGSDGLGPVGFAPGRGDRRIAVLGGRASGRSTALAALAAGLIELGRPVAVVAAATPTVGAIGWPAAAEVLRPDELDRLVALRRAHPSLAVLVDDAARLAGDPIETVLQEVLRLVDEDDGVIAVAATPAHVGESFRGLLAQVAGAGTGLLLGALGYGEEAALGLRRPVPTEELPGRGLLVRHGRATAVQVARPD